MIVFDQLIFRIFKTWQGILRESESREYRSRVKVDSKKLRVDSKKSRVDSKKSRVNKRHQKQQSQNIFNTIYNHSVTTAELQTFALKIATTVNNNNVNKRLDKKLISHVMSPSC